MVYSSFSREQVLLFTGVVLFLFFVVLPFFSPQRQAHNWDGKAWIAEPRHDMPGWTQTHEKYVQETKGAVAGKHLDLLFLGDSITEAWLGLDRGHDATAAALERDAPRVLL